MSETAAEATPDGNEGGQTSTAPNFEPITSQEEFDKALSKRLERERSKFADYEDLKTKASQLDALSEASKSDLERATEKATKAATERDEFRAEAMRLRIAVEHGISLEDADLFLTGKDEESLRAQAKRLSDREATAKKQGNVSPREGTNPRPSATDERSAVRTLFASGG